MAWEPAGTDRPLRSLEWKANSLFSPLRVNGFWQLFDTPMKKPCPKAGREMEIYEAMAVINRAFAQITSTLYKMELKGVLAEDYAYS